MSELRVYPETLSSKDGDRPTASYTRFEDIARELKAIGVLFERWTADRELDAEATQDEVIEAYREPIDRLMKTHGFRSVDVISVHPDHPQKDALRDKFLHEHTHTEFEVRFFVDGEGLFYIHHDGRVHGVRCTRGDLISVPAGYTHWFDMGPRPFLKAIRLFTTPEGWVAQFTGNKIADNFPRLDALPSAA
jgi:1,2-dihydroxy-3-keto-5-methylthiopentene dioxygenase